MARPKPRAFDTAISRGGDQVGAWSYPLLVWLGVSGAGIALLAALLAAAWLLNGFRLGREHEALGAAQASRSGRPASDLSRAGERSAS